MRTLGLLLLTLVAGRPASPLIRPHAARVSPHSHSLRRHPLLARYRRRLQAQHVALVRLHHRLEETERRYAPQVVLTREFVVLLVQCPSGAECKAPPSAIGSAPPDGFLPGPEPEGSTSVLMDTPTHPHAIPEDAAHAWDTRDYSLFTPDPPRPTAP